MEFFDAAKSSMELEQSIINKIMLFTQIADAFKYAKSGENIYVITVEVKQVHPPL